MICYIGEGFEKENALKLIDLYAFITNISGQIPGGDNERVPGVVDHHGQLWQHDAHRLVQVHGQGKAPPHTQPRQEQLRQQGPRSPGRGRRRQGRPRHAQPHPQLEPLRKRGE